MMVTTMLSLVAASAAGLAPSGARPATTAVTGSPVSAGSAMLAVTAR